MFNFLEKLSNTISGILIFDTIYSNLLKRRKYFDYFVLHKLI